MRARCCTGALVGAVVLLLSSGVAAAAPTGCATAPPTYTGTDPVVAAITQLNADADQNCHALADRLDQLDSDLTTGQTAAHADAQAIGQDVTAVHSVLAGWTSSNPLNVSLPAGGSGQAVQVTNWPTDQTVGLDPATMTAQDGIGQASHDDIWVLIGVVVGTFLLAEFLRKVWP